MTAAEKDKTYFDQTFNIRYAELDRRGEATPLSILTYLEETALSHSEAAGCGLEYLKQQGTAWVLNCWHLKMKAYPRWKESVTIRTWPTGFQRFYGYRQFLITDTQGQAIGCADSIWIYMNMEKKRPVRITEDLIQKYVVMPKKVFDSPMENWTTPENLPVKKQLPVLYSDIDTNGHVNNVRYLGWMLEGMPENLLSEAYMSELEIVYKKEADPGEPVLICYGEASEKTVCKADSGAGAEAAGMETPGIETRGGGAESVTERIHSIRQMKEPAKTMGTTETVRMTKVVKSAETIDAVELAAARTLWKPRKG